MEKENFDFYQEALKAFDAPIPEPKKEEPAQVPAAEVTEPVPEQPPKRKFNLWWMAAVCAVLCLVLVIRLSGGEDQCRGENYAIGMVLESGEGYVTLNTVDGIWYVELEGSGKSTGTLAAETYLWAFYNGEPEETDQKGCSKKITATFWKTDSELYSAKDEIKFDLDGDGKRETWSMDYGRSFLTPLGGSYSGLVRLTAKDARGNVLQDVYLISPATMGMAFHDAQGSLSLVLFASYTYSAMELRMEDGNLAVYQNGQKQKLFAAPDVQQTEPPITEPVITDPPVSPVEPTIGPVKSYSLMFFIPAGTTEGRIGLSAGDARVLQMQLDALDWVVADDVVYKVNWGFNFYESEEAECYQFSQGVLLHDGKQAKIGTELTEKLMGLMGQEMSAQKEYSAYLSNGEMLQILFYNSAMARIKVSDGQGNVIRSYMGRYSNIDQWYVLDLGEDPRHVMVLKPKAQSLEYVHSASTQNMFAEQGGLEFYTDDAGGALSLWLRNTDGSWAGKQDYVTLSVQATHSLREKLNNCDWQTDVRYTADEIVARFTVYDGAGNDLKNPELYYLLTGGRLLPQTPPGGKDRIATIDRTLWQLLASYFSRQGDHSVSTYGGLNQDGMEMALQLHNDGIYQIVTQGKENQAYTAKGTYVRIGEILVLLGWEDGPTYIHLNEENGNLKYDPARSTPGKTFGQTTEVTLFSLQVEAYRVAALQYSIRDDAGGDFYHQDGLVTLTDEIAGAVSLLLHTVQWERLQAEPTGIQLGSFSFQDVFPMSARVDVYSGMRLVYDGTYEAKLTESQWAIICVLMTSAGDDRLTGSYEAQVDTTSYSLLMGEQYQFLLCEGSQNYSEYVVGFYSVLQNQVMVCYGYNGEMFALRTDDSINWRLLPGYNGIETFNIPDGSVFEQPIVDIMPEESTPAT